MGTSLERYHHVLIKWSAKRTAYFDRELNKIHKEFLGDVMQEVGEIYGKYERDGKLTREDMYRFRRLDKFQRSLMGHVDIMSKRKQKAFVDLLNESYEHSYNWMSWAIESEARASFKKSLTQVERSKRALANATTGEKAESRIEWQRKALAEDMKKSVNKALRSGATYHDMSQELTKVFEGDKARTRAAARAEVRRVREQATFDVASQAETGGIVMMKRWTTMKDDRVRGAHKLLHNETIAVDALFELLGFTALIPTGFGAPALDYNCRCLLVYSIENVTVPTEKSLAKRTFNEYQKLQQDI